ncbi:UPF0126 membrane protein [Porphyridium purpureum]|uniref:UPF0126 membrane protein n=1 Tax=Porphyridium purpureum TaxID=35688 RepID=A0A5J4Z897_PORPP|nr:UPF0126 membrane protein [Porphyridium purpureum]|eukprot:POR6456..scf295_1
MWKHPLLASAARVSAALSRRFAGHASSGTARRAAATWITPQARSVRGRHTDVWRLGRSSCVYNDVRAAPGLRHAQAQQIRSVSASSSTIQTPAEVLKGSEAQPAAAGPAAEASEVAPAVHIDSMPRYPDLSPGGFLRAFDYIGTSIFALTGALTAASGGMDVLGCTVVGTITAVGGGTTRDLLMGARPVFWLIESEYIAIAVATSLLAFFFWPDVSDALGITEDEYFINVIDSWSLGAFSCIGTMNGIRAGYNPLIVLVCAVVTCTFGGVVRDTFLKRPVRVLHSYAEIYATTAAVGSIAYMAARAMQLPLVLRISLGLSSTFIMRLWAMKYGTRLPTYTAGASKPIPTVGPDVPTRTDVGEKAADSN